MPKIPLPAFLPSVQDVRDAAVRIRSAAKITRLHKSAALSSELHTAVYLKLELEQETGSFKVRGAFNVLASLTPEQRNLGVVASSAGNHGLGVAFASHAFNAPAMLYVPSTAPNVKKEGIAALGANRSMTTNPTTTQQWCAQKCTPSLHDIPFINPCLGVTNCWPDRGPLHWKYLEQCLRCANSRDLHRRWWFVGRHGRSACANWRRTFASLARRA